MAYPHLTIDLNKIEHNARTVVALCRGRGIEVAGVTKVTCGHPQVARSMLRGGVSAIADSRLENIRRLQAAGIEGPFLLLRVPALSQVDEVVESADFSLNSELVVLEGLSRVAVERGVVHGVILMVELGDRREGIPAHEFLSLVEQALRLPGIRIEGVGSNLACFGGVAPSAENMGRLVELAQEVERRFGLDLRWISGINSSGLGLIASGVMPRRINHARIGEAILLGRETVHRQPWPGTFQDAFTLHAEVLELKRKPSLPQGERGQDAFGGRPEFVDRGEQLRALLNVGREDVDGAGLTPLDPRLEILGASSGYLVLDAGGAEGEVRVGDMVGFALNYGALLTAMTSEYVKKRLM